MFRPINSVLVTTVVHFIAIVGCSTSAPSDAEQVDVTIGNLSEAATDPESFHSAFVDGSAPDESLRGRYRKYFYEMDPPKISGNTATAIVRIMNAAGDVLDEKEWVFSKVDAQWKISEAPLP